MTNQAQARPAEVDPLVLSRRAGGAVRMAALTIDALVPLALAATAGLLFAAGRSVPAWALLALAIVLVVSAAVMVARTGRSAGRLAAGTRTVRRADGTAPGRSLVPALLTGRLGTFDLRRGRDPFAPALTSLQFPAPSAVAAPPAPGGRGYPALTLDSGQRFTLETAVVIGRNPVAAPGDPAELHRWADMSRTLSKSHARLEWDGAQVWVTDLGSTNGTVVRTGSGVQPLPAHHRTPLPVGVVLELGDRTVTVGAAG